MCNFIKFFFFCSHWLHFGREEQMALWQVDSVAPLSPWNQHFHRPSGPSSGIEDLCLPRSYCLYFANILLFIFLSFFFASPSRCSHFVFTLSENLLNIIHSPTGNESRCSHVYRRRYERLIVAYCFAFRFIYHDLTLRQCQGCCIISFCVLLGSID